MSALTDPALPAPTRPPPSSRSRVVTWVLLALAAAVVLGVLAGVLWWQVVIPAYFERTGNEVVMTQKELALRYRQDGWFVTIGFLLSAVASGVLVWRGRATPTLAVLVAVVGSVVAALVCWQVGVHLGHVPVRQRALQATDGQRIPDTLHLLSRLSLLAWPAGAAGGATAFLFGTSGVHERESDRNDPSGG